MLDVTVGGAILAGLLSFLSPCVLPLVPPYLCFISGASLQDISERRNPSALLPASAFVLGFATVFVALGVSASFIGRLMAEHGRHLALVSGVLIVLLGLQFMGILPTGILNREVRFQPGRRPLGVMGAYLVGLAFAFGWTPCVGPILTTILLVAGAQDTVLRGTILLVAYAAGIGIPFLLAAMFVGAFLGWVRRFRQNVRWIERIAGALLVVTGALFLTNTMPAISYWLLESVPALGAHG
jgi:cytochrome c-type biogenesis protein